MKLVAFCEAEDDFRLLSGLFDRGLREHGPSWVVEGLDSPEAIRIWEPDGLGHAFFDVHHLSDYADKLGARPIRGHFNGKPGRTGAAMARKVFSIARVLHKKAGEQPLDAVVLLWDIDSQPDEREHGVEDARGEAKRWSLFEMICGLPDPCSQASIHATTMNERVSTVFIASLDSLPSSKLINCATKRAARYAISSACFEP